ncbi:MAG: multidrug effflux MFS transporter [Gammaproteobacteria bacterium]|nr:multidrug effflux MFS transporter [Gammaproteobacteria bacterium]MCW5582977.1 multidrug effflux MFS transporter [Gammaproteobacteria bacterium]
MNMFGSIAALLTVACSAQLASDIYSPSLPAISVDLHTSIAHVQFSMAIYMFGLAISQLFYGPLSEGLGRRIPLIAGLLILLLGNLVSLFAPTIIMLIVGSLIQGCDAGACSTLWRSIFRDTFEGAELAKYGAYFSIFITFIIPAAPALGGYLQEYFNWRANFVFLSLYSCGTPLMVWIGLKETSLHHHLERLKAKFIAESFLHVLSSPIFMGYTLCTFLCYGAFFSWFTTGPVLLIHNIGISPIEFGWITLFGGGFATASGGWVNGRLVTKLGAHTMLRIGFLIMFIAGVMMLIGKFLFVMNTFIIVAPMILFYFGVTFIWPSAFAGAFGTFGKMAGYAGILYGFMQISGAAAIGTIAAYLPHQSQISLALVFISTSILAWLIFEIIVRKKEEVMKEQ